MSDPTTGSWVPSDACQLPTAEQPLRVAEFQELFTTSLIGTERMEPGWLRLRLRAEPGVEPTVRDLVARESECCAFFDFRVSSFGSGSDAELRVDVRVPPERADVLDGLALQASARPSRRARP